VDRPQAHQAHCSQLVASLIWPVQQSCRRVEVCRWCKPKFLKCGSTRHKDPCRLASLRKPFTFVAADTVSTTATFVYQLHQYRTMARNITNPSLGYLSVLPREIRDQIYHEVKFAADTGYHFAFNWHKEFEEVDCPTIKNLSCLTRTSKTLRDEYMDQDVDNSCLYLSLFISSKYLDESQFVAPSNYTRQCRKLFIHATLRRTSLAYPGFGERGHPTRLRCRLRILCYIIRDFFNEVETVEVCVTRAPWEIAFTAAERKEIEEYMPEHTVYYDDYHDRDHGAGFDPQALLEGERGSPPRVSFCDQTPWMEVPTAPGSGLVVWKGSGNEPKSY